VDECRNDPKQKRKMYQKKSENNRFHWFDLLRKGPGFSALIASQQIRRSGRLTKLPIEDEIRSVYDEFAISKPDQRAMLHLADNLNLQSEIFSSLGLGFLFHKSSFTTCESVAQLTSSVGHFAGSRQETHHEIGCFFPTTAASISDNAIVVAGTTRSGSDGDVRGLLV